MNKFIRITWCDANGLSEASKDYLTGEQLVELLKENAAIIEESNGIYIGHDPDACETFVITDLEYLPR